MKRRRYPFRTHTGLGPAIRALVNEKPERTNQELFDILKTTWCPEYNPRWLRSSIAIQAPKMRRAAQNADNKTI